MGTERSSAAGPAAMPIGIFVIEYATTRTGTIQKSVRWSQAIVAARSVTCHQRPRTRTETSAIEAASESTCGRNMRNRKKTLGTATRKAAAHHPAAGTSCLRSTQRTVRPSTAVRRSEARRMPTAGSSTAAKGVRTM